MKVDFVLLFLGCKESGFFVRQFISIFIWYLILRYGVFGDEILLDFDEQDFSREERMTSDIINILD